MIKQTLVLSLLLTSVQAMASTPCPTCKKGYVASSLEEVLIARQKAKGLDLKTILEDSSISQDKKGESALEKLPITHRVNQGQKNTYQPHTSRSRAPKRDEILGAIDASPKSPPAGSIYFSQDQGNKNLRGTFDRTMAFGMQQQLQQHIRNLRR